MQVFPIFSADTAPGIPCCIFSSDADGTERLHFFDAEGRLLPDLRVGTVPGGTHLLCEGQITGGTFIEYLAALEPEHTCLCLERVRMRFPLPCPTGTGKALTEAECAGILFRFSPELGCRYALCGGEMFLCDDTDSLRYRFQAAEQAGISLLIAEPDLLRDLSP